MALQAKVSTGDCLERFREVWNKGALRCAKKPFRMKPGNVLFRAGQPAQGVFLVRKGTVRLSLQTATKPITIRVLRAGEFVGLLPTLSFREHPLTAEALEEVEAEGISPQEFMKVLTANPQHWPLVLEVLCLDVEYAHEGLRNHIR